METLDFFSRALAVAIILGGLISLAVGLADLWDCDELDDDEEG